MKSILILCTFIYLAPVFAQKQKTLKVKNDDLILKGIVAFESVPELFVGQEYFFTMISNNTNLDLEIMSENLNVTLLPESKKTTGGLRFKVVPLDTGDCMIQLALVTEEKRTVGLVAHFFHASLYPMPPVFIAGIRSGETITELDTSAGLSCRYDQSMGIFEPYEITSWTAKLGALEFTGTGSSLSSQLIDAVNKASANEVLRLTVELGKNNTGYKTSEAVFMLK